MLHGASASRQQQDLLWHYRNLGKAFYENPTTQKDAVVEFKKAFDVVPNSARERVNYGLALLRAGLNKDGVAELAKAQRQDPAIPHTWFNLGIVYKKDGDYEHAIQQLEGMTKLVPDEPITHYNLGVLYKLAGKPAEGLKQLELAEKLNPNLAGPHFQLFNQYRQAGRTEDSARELKIFQEIKKRQAGAAVPEDMEWSYYAEIYETVEPQPADEAPARLKFADHPLPGHFDAATAGMAVLDLNGDGHADLIAWSAEGVHLYKDGKTAVAKSGLEDLRNVRSVAPGDFDNDGLPDLCVLTGTGAELYHNRKGSSRKFPRDYLPAPTRRRYGSITTTMATWTCCFWALIRPRWSPTTAGGLQQSDRGISVRRRARSGRRDFCRAARYRGERPGGCLSRSRGRHISRSSQWQV